MRRSYRRVIESIESRRLFNGGIRDLGFGNGGSVDASALSLNGFDRMAQQPDGSILISANSVARLSSNGQLDTSFGVGGISAPPAIVSGTWRFAMAPDGGYFLAAQAGNQSSDFHVARFDANGHPDLTFGNGAGYATLSTFYGDFRPGFMKVLADGSLLLGGNGFTGLFKITPGGAYDATFVGNQFQGTSPIGNGQAWDVIELPDGDLFVAFGNEWLLEPGSTTGRPAIVRLNPNGTIDPSFAPAIVNDPDAWTVNPISLARQSSGRLLLSCNWADDCAILAFNSSGQPDPAWGDDGFLRYNFAAIREQPTELLVHADDSLTLSVSAYFALSGNIADALLVHLNPEGERDALFGSNGVARFNGGPADSAVACAQQADGKLLLLSTPSPQTAGALVRYSAPVTSSPISVTSDGELQIIGSGSVDVITIAETATQYIANLNGNEGRISRSLVSRVFIAAGGGDDSITLNLQSDVPVTANGGSGSDALHLLYPQTSGLNVRNPQSDDGTLWFTSDTQPVLHQSVEYLDMGAALPFLSSARIELDTRCSLELTFNVNLGESLSVLDLQLKNLGTSAFQPIAPEDLQITTLPNGNTHAAILLSPSLPSAHWQLDVLAGSISSAGVVSDFQQRVRFDYSPGDINGNGLTDFSDLLVIVQRFGQSVSGRSQGDVNYDGRVGFEDLLAVAQNFNLPAPLPILVGSKSSKRGNVGELIS